MTKKLLLWLGIVALLTLGALMLLTPKVEPDPPLPIPNGYDDFTKAATLIEPNPPDWQRLSGDEQITAIRKLVATNQAALDVVRVGLAKRCFMPPWQQSGTNCPHLYELAASKRIANAFAAASKLALVEGHTNEAGIYASDCIRYGHESARGGVIIDGLVGVAVRAIGIASLKGTVDGLDLKTTRETLTALESALADEESIEVVLKRERQWARQGRFGRVSLFERLILPFQERKIIQKTRQKFAKIDLDIMQTQLQLAAHAYELEQGKRPAASKDLVPLYLKAVPLDPETGKEMQLN